MSRFLFLRYIYIYYVDTWGLDTLRQCFQQVTVLVCPQSTVRPWIPGHIGGKNGFKKGVENEGIFSHFWGYFGVII